MAGLVLRTQLYDNNPPGLSLKTTELSWAEGDSNFLYLLTNMSGSTISITGNTTIAGTLLVTGLITGTITNANNAITASYILSSGVDGPHGMNSILSASYAVSASYAPFAGGVFGGVANYVPLWTGPSTLTISNIYQTPSTNYIGIGTTTPSHNLEVNGTIAFPSLTTTSPLTKVVMWDQGSGKLYYTSSTAIAGTFSPGGTNYQIQFNDNGVFGGVPTLIYNGSTLQGTGSFSGSFKGTFTGSFSGSFTGSLLGTSSWALNALFAKNASASLTSISASYADTAGFTITSSYSLLAKDAISASYAVYADSSATSSFALTASYITSSKVFGPYGSGSIESASYASSSLSASYAATASYALTNLQQVTNNGSSSTNDIYVEGVKITSGSSTIVTTLDHLNGGGRLIFKAPSPNNNTISVTTPAVALNRNLSLPDGNGYLVLTVNGYPANSAGNVNIGTSGGGGGITGSGELNYAAYWSGSTTSLSSSTIYFDDIIKSIGIGTTTPSGAFTVSGSMYLWGLENKSQSYFITYDSSSGKLFYFNTASWAYSASQALTASFTSFAVSASYASSSTSASYALTSSLTLFAVSASYASSSTSASYALTSSLALFTVSSSYASSSTSASFALTSSLTAFAVSSSYASSSTSASYALTSSLALFTVSSSYASSSTSASYALTASIAISSSYPIWSTGSTIYSTGPLATSNPNPTDNIFLGSGTGAGGARVTGSIFLGKNTGQNSISASNSILIGSNVGYVGVTSDTVGNNSIIIGTNITLPPNTNNAINIGGLIFGTGSYSSNTVSSNPAGGRVGVNITSPLFNFHASGTVSFPSLGTTSSVTNVIMWNTDGQLFYTASKDLRPDSASYALTSSYTNFVLSASYASSSTSASYALTASYTPNAGSLTNALTQGKGILTFTYNGSAAQQVAVSGAINLSNNRITKWIGDSSFANSSLLDDGNNITGTTSIQLTGTNSILSGSFSGSFTGSLFGTSSWAQSSSQALTASYVTGSIFSGSNLALSASYALTASYVTTTPIKAGVIEGAAFTGNPKAAVVNFTTNFPDNNYAVTLTGQDARSWTITTKTWSYFSASSNSNTALTGPVYWIAVPFNS